MICNASMKIANMLENEQAVAVFDRFLPNWLDEIRQKC